MTHLDNQCRGTIHVGSVDAIEISFNLRYTRPCCRWSKTHAQNSSGQSQYEIGPGEEKEPGKVSASKPFPKSMKISLSLLA